MVKFTQCLRRKLGASIPDFRRDLKRYTEAARRVVELVGAQRLTVATTLAVDANLEVMARRGTGAPFDAVVEFAWPGTQEVLARLDDDRVQAAIAAMQAIQEEAIDLDRSVFFFSAEEVIVDG